MKSAMARCLCALLLSGCLFATAHADPVALMADRVIEGSADQALQNAVVVVEGEKITYVGARDGIPDNARRIDLGDATLMPGMIDAHAHPISTGGDYQIAHLSKSSAAKALGAAAYVQNLLLAGWTGLRVAGDGDVFYAPVDLKRAIDAGTVLGPRMAVAAHYISITGGGGDVNFMSPEQHLIADGLVVDGVEEIRKAVREEIKYGSDWIKVLATGAYLSVGDNPANVSFSPEEFSALMEEAARQDVPVMAHAHATAGIKQAVLGGARSIEHGTFLDDEVIDLMAEHGTWLIPTIYIGDYYYEKGTLREDERNDYYFEHEKPVWMEWLRKAHRKGVKIGVGLDFGQGDPPEAYADEFRMLTDIGMSNMEAIQAGTRVNAELLEWDDRLGTLEAGKLADVIAVPGNPLEDIRALERTIFVMTGGRIVKSPDMAPPPEGLFDPRKMGSE